MSGVIVEVRDVDGVEVVELGDAGPQGAIGQPIAGATPPATYDPDTHLVGVDVGTGADQVAAGDAPAAARDAAIAAAAIDTDTDVDEEASARSAADNAHVAAPDPHPGYLTSAEGNAAYDALGAAAAALATANADTDTDVGEEAALRVSGDAASIVAANAHADAADNAHVAAGDPHPVYLTTTEGNAAYDAIQSLASVAATGVITANTTLVTAGATTKTMTLPTAVGIIGIRYSVKKVDSGVGGVIVATTSSQTIDGLTMLTLTSQYENVAVISDGANWMVV